MALGGEPANLCRMTLIIGKHCSNGVLLIADSISKPDNGGPNAYNAVKSHHDVRGQDPFGVVFAGYASTPGGLTTLAVIQQAAAMPVGSIQDCIRDAIRARLNDEVTDVHWTDAYGVVNNVGRDHFKTTVPIIVFLGIRPNELWVIWTTAAKLELFQQIAPGQMVVPKFGSDPALYQQIDGLRDNHPQTLREAAATAGTLFHRATQLLPNDCGYPGTVLFLMGNGIHPAQFNSPAELQAAAAQYAP